jgi:adenine-specific DNA-methyltransferase
MLPVAPVCEPEPMEAAHGTLTREVEDRRSRVSLTLDPLRRADLGQFFTPDPVARLLASMFHLTDKPATMLDPGAGVGSLTAAFVARWSSECESPLIATACEVDAGLYDELADTLAACERHGRVTATLHPANFIEWAVDTLGGVRLVDHPGYDYIVMNPPYRKLASRSRERDVLRSIGLDAPNLYAAFLALGACLLSPGAQLVAITPRSFANGPYFKSFRRDFLDRVGLRHIHVYDSRGAAFSDADVLQENVVFLAERSAERPAVLVTSSHSPASTNHVSRTVPYDEVVHPDDPERFVHLTPDEEQATVAAAVSALPTTIAALGATVSTGKVVDFRSKEHLRPHPGDDTVPLVYPTHMAEGAIAWPKRGKKPNALVRCVETEQLLLPAGWYVVVKRFSAKEERRRVVASLVRGGDLPGDRWAFENHLNVFHDNQRGLDPLLAAGLATWLNSTAVDTAFRQFSGHTQVNATDLRNMRYPTAPELVALGAAAEGSLLAQETVDALVARHVTGMLA